MISAIYRKLGGRVRASKSAEKWKPFLMIIG
jgi:hypothetical protein